MKSYFGEALLILHLVLLARRQNQSRIYSLQSIYGIFATISVLVKEQKQITTASEEMVENISNYPKLLWFLCEGIVSPW